MKKLSALLLSAALLLCACGEYPDATDPAPFGDDDPAPVFTEESSELTEADITTAMDEVSSEEDYVPPEWLIYEKARDDTLALDDREYQTMVYTRLESSGASVTQSLNIRIRYHGANSSSPQIAAKGTVKAKERMIDIEMYYRDGCLYSSSGDSRNRQDTYFDAAAGEVDVLHAFRRELGPGHITSITVEDNVDGTKQVSMSFRGLINGLDTTGSGEIVIGTGGLIVSEGYSFSAVNQGKKTDQSVEVTLIGYGDDLPSIEFPDLSVY